METIGYWRLQLSQKLTISSLEQLALVALLEDVLLLFLVVELAGRGIERDGDLLAGLVAGRFDGFEDQFDGFVVRLERRSKAAFIADRRVVALLLEHALQRVEGLGSPAQRVAEALRADGHDHEFLEVDVRVGMRAAIEHVHHRRGQHAGVDAAEVAVERNLKRLRDGARGRPWRRREWHWRRACLCWACRRARSLCESMRR